MVPNLLMKNPTTLSYLYYATSNLHCATHWTLRSPVISLNFSVFTFMTRIPLFYSGHSVIVKINEIFMAVNYKPWRAIQILF